MDNNQNKKIYIAGFDVFKTDPIKIGNKYKKICKLYGFTGLYPLDNELDDANEIFKGDIRLIKESDIIA